MEEFIENDCDFERWVKVKDPEILKKVDINYPDSCMSTNWLAEVIYIDEDGEFFESDSITYILSIHGGLNGNGNWSTYLQDVEYVVSMLSERFRSVELYDWKNDILDDVWDLKLVLRSQVWKTFLMYPQY